MNLHRHLPYFVLTCVLVPFSARAECHDAEPQASFALKKGWVEVTLRKNGKPLANAKVQVIDEAGKNFADGETGDDGQAAFPMPRGASFAVEIKAGEKTSDPIRLYKSDGGIAPARVLLSYGLRPCCRSKGRDDTVTVAPIALKGDLVKEVRDDLEKRNFRPLSATLESLIADTKYDPIPTQAHTLLLQAAPDFTLLDVHGKKWSLGQHLKDGPVVLVFYYGYFCNHCVSQLFALEKDLAKFREQGVTIVAISPDSAELTRERFKQYGAFTFPVLSDPGSKIAEKYETFVANIKEGKEGDQLHGTFVLTRSGAIAWTNRGEGPFTENRTLLLEAARAEKRVPKR